MASRKHSRSPDTRATSSRLTAHPLWRRLLRHPATVFVLALCITTSLALGGWALWSSPSPKSAATSLPPPIHLSSALSNDGQRVIGAEEASAAPPPPSVPVTPAPVTEPLAAPTQPLPPAAAPQDDTSPPSSAMGYNGHLYEEPNTPGVRITDTLSIQEPPPPPAAPQAPTPKPAPAAKPATKQAGEQLAGGMPSPAWLKNATPPPATGSKAQIAIVIDDMGVDVKRSARIVALPGPLTTSYLTYGHNLPEQTRHARQQGHELMVHFPMEPQAKNVDPGPDALRVGLDDAEIKRRLDLGLSHFDGYVGINNHMGSKFTENAPGMREVMQALKARGVFWLDSRTSPKSVGEAMAAQAGIPHIGRDVFLDNDESVSSVMTQLAQLEKIAHKQGYAIAIGHPRDQTIAALASWLPSLAQKGLVLVPLSTIVRERNGQVD